MRYTKWMILMIWFLMAAPGYGKVLHPPAAHPLFSPLGAPPLWESAWEIPLPIFLVAGIYGRFVAVSEAAVVSALYVLVVEVFVYQEIRPSQLLSY